MRFEFCGRDGLAIVTDIAPPVCSPLPCHAFIYDLDTFVATEAAFSLWRGFLLFDRPMPAILCLAGAVACGMAVYSLMNAMGWERVVR